MFVCKDCLPKQVNAAGEPFVVAYLDTLRNCICENARADFSLVLVSDIFNGATEDDWGVKSHYHSTFNLAFKNLS